MPRIEAQISSVLELTVRSFGRDDVAESFTVVLMPTRELSGNLSPPITRADAAFSMLYVISFLAYVCVCLEAIIATR